jgi:hypothetical protein
MAGVAKRSQQNRFVRVHEAKVEDYKRSWVDGRTQVNSYNLYRTEKFPYSATSYGREQAKGDYREDKRNLIENNTDFMLTYSKSVTPIST